MIFPRVHLSFSLIVLLLFYTAATFSTPAQATRQLERETRQTTEKRTALVIGNSTYTTSPLTNPANDAADMAAALKELDFEVFSGVNQSRTEMVRLIRQFGERLKTRGGVGLFYYAGHGVQVDGRNFLVPTDASIRSENEVELEAVDVSRVLVEMENAGNSLNVVILDACRNNPFSRSWRSTNDGLAQINAPSGTMIAYSTAPGKVASDGAGRNAPYTAALLRAIRTPGMSLSDVFMKVRADVQQVTNRKQTTWEASSVIGQFYFRKGTAGEIDPKVSTEAQVEQEYWESVKDSRAVADLQGYLTEYPSGRFAALARLRIRQFGGITKMEPSANSDPEKVFPGSVRKNSIGMELVWIPPGDFLMGSESGEANEKPTHRVRISQGYWMGRYEVTQAQYRSMMTINPSNFKGCDQCPVEQVSRNDAKEFISQLNAKNDGFVYRLPTEAEWEYAARAGTTGPYSGDIDAMAWYDANSGSKTLHVGQKQANSFGLYDIHGNVWEWCEDWYGEYSAIAAIDPMGVGSGQSGVFRGGSWFSSAGLARSSLRVNDSPSVRSSDLGFRVVAVRR